MFSPLLSFLFQLDPIRVTANSFPALLLGIDFATSITAVAVASRIFAFWANVDPAACLAVLIVQEIRVSSNRAVMVISAVSAASVNENATHFNGTASLREISVRGELGDREPRWNADCTVWRGARCL